MPTIFNLFKNNEDAESFSAGEKIFEEGQQGEVMYAISNGEVEIIYDGKVISNHGPGEIFGEMALIDSNQRSASAVAKTDCELVSIDEKRFLFLVQQNPYFPLQLMRMLAERLRLSNQSC